MNNIVRKTTTTTFHFDNDNIYVTFRLLLSLFYFFFVNKYFIDNLPCVYFVSSIYYLFFGRHQSESNAPSDFGSRGEDEAHVDGW
jgi:hypothetical protein